MNWFGPAGDCGCCDIPSSSSSSSSTPPFYCGFCDWPYNDVPQRGFLGTPVLKLSISLPAVLEFTTVEFGSLAYRKVTRVYTGLDTHNGTHMFPLTYNRDFCALFPSNPETYELPYLPGSNAVSLQTTTSGLDLDTCEESPPQVSNMTTDLHIGYASVQTGGWSIITKVQINNVISIRGAIVFECQHEWDPSKSEATSNNIQTTFPQALLTMVDNNVNSPRLNYPVDGTLWAIRQGGVEDEHCDIPPHDTYSVMSIGSMSGELIDVV